MPPRAAEMVSRADHDGHEGTTTQQSTAASVSSFEVKNNSSISSIKSANKSSRRRRRAGGTSVSFATDLQSTEVEHMDDLPGDDIWYSREEYDSIKARNSYIVRLIKAGEFEENEDLSCRGLEHKLKEVFRQRRANKFNALNAVLEEQDRQINRGVVDAHLISAAYQTVSVRCQESANTIAFRDYRFSHNYCPNTPATGNSQPAGNGGHGHLGDSTSAMTPPTYKGEKKKKKKDKKDKNAANTSDNNNNQDDPSLSPKGEKKKGGVRKMARGARKMMRRMSM